METVLPIIERKEKGIDCSESESAEIKGFIRETIIAASNTNCLNDFDVLHKIIKLFPIEYSEILVEIEEK